MQHFKLVLASTERGNLCAPGGSFLQLVESGFFILVFSKYSDFLQNLHNFLGWTSEYFLIVKFYFDPLLNFFTFDDAIFLSITVFLTKWTLFKWVAILNLHSRISLFSSTVNWSSFR